MITEYPLEHRRYDQSEYEPFWAAAEALDLPLSLRRNGKVESVGPARRCCATQSCGFGVRYTNRAVLSKAFLPSPSMGSPMHTSFRRGATF